MTDPVVGERPEPWSVPVVLHDPDPAWAELFAADALAIRWVLRDRVLAVDHVGSTSVPGLPAKPILDILLQVDDSADEGAYVPALESLGYWLQVREAGWLEHRVLYQRVERGCPHDINLHVLSPGRAAEEIGRMLGLRNWLRSHPVDRERYAAVKRELARRRWRYVQDYADAKTEVVEEILVKVAQVRG
ncbi:GrpB family protein [Knoellia sp. Soil729]|uniref:GrpB family protein n=1 Tax=Knoellia sp. Soil729 TaxID=1736394 RepID=UPI001F1C99B1|nr:GrpB family protein [Knoellia sp. Soil729]